MTRLTKTELYFGRKINYNCPDCHVDVHGYVSDTEFQEFKVNVIDCYFKAYTLHDARGAWCGDTEPTKVMTIIWDPRDVSKGEKSNIDLVISEYKKRFHQESVMQVNTVADVSFK